MDPLYASLIPKLPAGLQELRLQPIFASGKPSKKQLEQIGVRVARAAGCTQLRELLMRLDIPKGHRDGFVSPAVLAPLCRMYTHRLGNFIGVRATCVGVRKALHSCLSPLSLLCATSNSAASNTLRFNL